MEQKRTILENNFLSIKSFSKKTKLIFRFLNWSKFSESKKTFYFIIWRWRTKKKLQTILSSDCRNKKFDVMNDGQNFFDPPVKHKLMTYDNIQKIAIVQGDDYITGCLLDYNYFKKYCKMIAIDLSKQQALDAYRKAIQQINFTGNLDWAEGATIFFIIEEVNQTFSEGIVKVLWMCSSIYFALI